jgi:hypothetical protein
MPFITALLNTKPTLFFMLRGHAMRVGESPHPYPFQGLVRIMF